MDAHLWVMDWIGSDLILLPQHSSCIYNVHILAHYGVYKELLVKLSMTITKMFVCVALIRRDTTWVKTINCWPTCQDALWKLEEEPMRR